jgi:hypothetical protein
VGRLVRVSGTSIAGVAKDHYDCLELEGESMGARQQNNPTSFYVLATISPAQLSTDSRRLRVDRGNLDCFDKIDKIDKLLLDFDDDSTLSLKCEPATVRQLKTEHEKRTRGNKMAFIALKRTDYPINRGAGKTASPPAVTIRGNGQLVANKLASAPLDGFDKVFLTYDAATRIMALRGIKELPAKSKITMDDLFDVSRPKKSNTVMMSLASVFASDQVGYKFKGGNSTADVIVDTEKNQISFKLVENPTYHVPAVREKKEDIPVKAKVPKGAKMAPAVTEQASDDGPEISEDDLDIR